MQPFLSAQTLMPPPRWTTTRLISRWSFLSFSATILTVALTLSAWTRLVLGISGRPEYRATGSSSSTHGGSTMKAGILRSQPMPYARTAPRLEACSPLSAALASSIMRWLTPYVPLTVGAKRPPRPTTAARLLSAMPLSSRNSRIIALRYSYCAHIVSNRDRSSGVCLILSSNAHSGPSKTASLVEVDPGLSASIRSLPAPSVFVFAIVVASVVPPARRATAGPGD